MRKTESLPPGCYIPENVLLTCLSERRRSLVDISKISFNLATPSVVDKIPKIYNREYIGRGDEHLEETVSFVLNDGRVLPNIVPQEWDSYVDEVGQSPHKKEGRAIKEVLSEYSGVRLVLIHTWDFDSGATTDEEIKDIDTITILEFKS